MKDRAAQFGMIGESLAKNEIVLQGGLKSLEICKRHGIPVAYGSDLLGELHWDQSQGVHASARRWSRRSRSSARRPRSAPRCCACRARWARLQAGAFADAHPGRRQSAERPCAAWRSGQTSLRDHEGRHLAQEPAELMIRLNAPALAGRGHLGDGAILTVVARDGPRQRVVGRIALERRPACRLAYILTADVLRDLAGVLPPGDPVVSAGRLLAEMVPRRSRQRQLRQRLPAQPAGRRDRDAHRPRLGVARRALCLVRGRFAGREAREQSAAAAAGRAGHRARHRALCLPCRDRDRDRAADPRLARRPDRRPRADRHPLDGAPGHGEPRRAWTAPSRRPRKASAPIA